MTYQTKKLLVSFIIGFVLGVFLSTSTVFIYHNLGLILNIVGTLLMAFSFGPYPDKDGAPYTGEEGGSKKYIAYFNYPIMFWTGAGLMLLGFVVQLQF